MISRRSLFGLGAGAAVSAVVPLETPAQYGTRLAKQTGRIIVGLDFGRPPAAAFFKECVLDVRFSPLTDLPITWMGENHNHMRRDTLIEFVEALDWNTFSLNKRIKQMAEIYGRWMLDVPLTEDIT